jgi:SAM-dependent methyltransferase
MTDFKNIDQNLKGYYQNRKGQFGLNAQGVGYKTTEAQSNTFSQLVKVLEAKTDFSVADLGCGLGHLYGFLLQSGCTNFRYTGYDTLQEMVNESEKLHGGTGAQFRRISKAAEMDEADYILAAGIFNLRFSMAEHQWLAYMLETMQMMFEKSKKGFAFNALTKYSDKEFMRPELFYSDPCFLFDYCKRNFSRNVALLHDYTLYEFTIIVRKNV